LIMPRRSRVFIEGGIYHVYKRFARGAEIFREGNEAVTVLGFRKLGSRSFLRSLSLAPKKDLEPGTEMFRAYSITKLSDSTGIGPTSIW